MDLIDPAVRGTLNVLRSFAKVSSIRRVVVTSSMAAGAFIGKTLTPGVVVDETWFSDPAVCEKLKVSFCSFLWILSPFQVFLFQLLYAKKLAVKG